MDLFTGIKATRDGFAFIKGLREALKRDEVDPHDVANRLMEIQELLLELQSAFSDALEQNRELTRQVEELRRVADIGKQFTLAEGVYWYNAYPYCPNCWETDRKPVRLAGPYGTNVPGRSRWCCHIHQKAIYLNSRQLG